MAKRYICRFFLVELPDGRIRVTYENPGEQFTARPIDMIGPAPLRLPEAPQTPQEHDQWLWRLLRPNGQYTMRIASRALDLPPVEEEDVPDGVGVLVKADIETYQREGKRRTLLVTVANIGNLPVRQLSVHWVGEHEAPQPIQVGKVQALDLGGTMNLLPATSFSGTLGPGDRTSFLLDERMIDGVLSQIASLSPERYWVSIRSGESEVLRLDGCAIGAFIEEVDAE